ncbi:hypothetical protein [Rheinheimera pacifica]|uniref:hypothetical protein n=1 Tax=Rheinheimera pacifica TaxID=173990 RepID=UPI002EDAFA45
MNTYADKVKNNVSNSVVDQTLQKKRDGESVFKFSDNRPESVMQRKIQQMANNRSRNSQLKVNINSAQMVTDNVVVQRVVAAGLLPGMQVVINAGNLAGTVVTIHHEDPNFHGHHVYFVNIPGMGVAAPLLLNELDPFHAAAPAA